MSSTDDQAAATIDDGEPTMADSREARINHDPDGEPIGVMVFLSDDELARLGTDPKANDAVTYWIEDGNLRIQ